MSKFRQISMEDMEMVIGKKNPLYPAVLMWLYQKAVYSEYTKDINGVSVTLHPGQYVCTYQKIADDIGADREKVKRCIEWMEKNGILTKVRKQHCIIVTLEHWVTNNSTQAVHVDDISTWRKVALKIGGIMPKEYEQAYTYYENNDFCFGSGTQITTEKEIADALKGWTGKSKKSKPKQTPSNDEDVYISVEAKEARIRNLKRRLQQQSNPVKRMELESELEWRQAEIEEITRAHPEVFGICLSETKNLPI